MTQAALHGFEQQEDGVVAGGDLDADLLVSSRVLLGVDDGGIRVAINGGSDLLGELVTLVTELLAGTVSGIGILAGLAVEGVGLKVPERPEFRVGQLAGGILDEADHLQVGEASAGSHGGRRAAGHGGGRHVGSGLRRHL